MGAKKRVSKILSAPYEFVLRVKEGADKGIIFALSKDRMIVGRSAVAHADIEINEIFAAPSHFEIYWDESIKSHIVGDRGARNKVYVNGHALKILTAKELRLGDEIRVGNTIFIYERIM